jgi:hypothetical protein
MSDFGMQPNYDLGYIWANHDMNLAEAETLIRYPGRRKT